MASLADIERLQKAIKIAEDRLAVVKAALDGVEKDIDMVSTNVIQLKRNIHYLKKKNTVALASEYKKVKQELEDAQDKLMLYRLNREDYRTVYSGIEIDVLKLKEELTARLNDPGAQVIEGSFKRINGR
jgi:chromosome segregation ATPase